jgi:hypothetical protein
MPARKVPRSIYESARDVAPGIAKTTAYVTSRRERKKIEMLFAHLKRILRLDRLRLRGPCGAHDEFLLAATAQNLRKLAKQGVAEIHEHGRADTKDSYERMLALVSKHVLKDGRFSAY